ncbi:hypothetical protein JYT75_01190 [Oceanicaulis sp. AH-315-P02]|nr:hypothetical protein [Robiginitomaculum sp.]MBN4047913.1 hypothetical protein [Oceanicaulis sp. AH-315-P02]
MNNYKLVYHFAFLVVIVSLSGCLTPEERSQVYGNSEPNDTQSNQLVLDDDNVIANTEPQTGYDPPKAAPTTVVTTNTIAPISGLRSADDDFRATAVSCGADELRYLQGQALASLRSMKFKQRIRIILPGREITDDYKPMRLNFDVTSEGIIGRLWCG